MGNKRFSIRCILICISFLALSICSVSAQTSPTVKVDGKTIVYSSSTGYPFYDDHGRMQVPFRATLEKIGATIGYDSKTKTAIAEKDGIKVEVAIGTYNVYKNGQLVVNDTASIGKDGKTYIPVRIVLEAFGYTLTVKSNTLSISKGEPSSKVSLTQPITQVASDYPGMVKLNFSSLENGHKYLMRADNNYINELSAIGILTPLDYKYPVNPGSEWFIPNGSYANIIEVDSSNKLVASKSIKITNAKETSIDYKNSSVEIPANLQEGKKFLCTVNLNDKNNQPVPNDMYIVDISVTGHNVTYTIMNNSVVSDKQIIANNYSGKSTFEIVIPSNVPTGNGFIIQIKDIYGNKIGEQFTFSK